MQACLMIRYTPVQISQSRGASTQDTIPLHTQTYNTYSEAADTQGMSKAIEGHMQEAWHNWTHLARPES